MAAHDAMGNGIGIRTNGEWSDELPNAKVFGVRIRKGDAYMMRSGGGGGFGTPLERDPELVAHDVREGYVSREAARDSYGVVICRGWGAGCRPPPVDLRRQACSPRSPRHEATRMFEAFDMTQPNPDERRQMAHELGEMWRRISRQHLPRARAARAGSAAV